jgi:outer membrane protein TolC
MLAKTLKTLIVAVAVFVLAGCSPKSRFLDTKAIFPDAAAEQLIRNVNYEETIEPSHDLSPMASVPFALDTDSSAIEYWDLTLDEAIQCALSNASVLRDLGGRLIQAPGLVPTIYDPSIESTDPRFGTEAALSAFDAEFTNSAFFEKNDRALNNALLGGGTNFFLQDLWRNQSELTKRSATGTQFSLRHYIEDDYNNATDNIFGKAGQFPGHAWTWNTEAEVRQPLLQGRGVDFNRIAGPDATPGQANGIVIARVNLEISTADFQLAVRDYLSNVENAYWELVFAYRDLDVKKKARDQSLETWQRLENLKGQREGVLQKRAQAAEQYYRFQEDVETALSGRLVDGTRDFSGSTGGTFQGTGGVYVAERRLRLIMGVPINDNRLIRPITDPPSAQVVLNWEQVTAEALSQRTELVRQRLRIKRGNLELFANRNFLLPRLDAIGRYRRRGLGDGLYDPSVPNPANPIQNVDSGSDEWQVGMELYVPLGFRKASAGVRNAELAVARERAILAEMERQIVHDLSNAVGEQTRSFQLVQTAYNRRVNAETQFEILSSEKSEEDVDYNIVLDSIRRLADSETAYNRALIGYAVALKNLHVETGDLMQYCNVQYSDGG